jgi:hypothetical protein
VRRRDPIDCSLVPADPDATSALRDSDAPEDGASQPAGRTTREPASNGREAGTGPATGAPHDADQDADAALEQFFRDADSGSGGDARDRRSVTRTTATAAATAPAAERTRYQARKVHRLVRHIEPWSVLKISLIFYFCLWVIMLVAAVLLWQVASGSGLIDNVQSFIEEIFALEPNSFAFEAGQMFRAYAVGGLVMVVAATGFTVLLAVLFNLISDLTGGVRVTVLEEESARPVPPAPRAGAIPRAVPAPQPATPTGRRATGSPR